MTELIELLEDINPDVDYRTRTDLIDGKILNSFEIVSLITELEEHFDIRISPKYLTPKHFNSAAAMWEMICLIQEDD